MIRRAILSSCLILLGGMVATAGAQQTPASTPGRAYKVAFWFERDRPFSSVKYQAYDLATGQYDEAAVARWQETIFAKHPGFGAVVRDLSTEGEPGATEPERLASAVAREKQRWVDLNVRSTRPVPKWAIPSPSPRSLNENASRASFDRPAPGSPGVIARPPTSPFPYPYRSGSR